MYSLFDKIGQCDIMNIQKRLPVCPPVSFGPGGFFCGGGDGAENV